MEGGGIDDMSDGVLSLWIATTTTWADVGVEGDSNPIYGDDEIYFYNNVIIDDESPPSVEDVSPSITTYDGMDSDFSTGDNLTDLSISDRC